MRGARARVALSAASESPYFTMACVGYPRWGSVWPTRRPLTERLTPKRRATPVPLAPWLVEAGTAARLRYRCWRDSSLTAANCARAKQLTVGRTGYTLSSGHKSEANKGCFPEGPCCHLRPLSPYAMSAQDLASAELFVREALAQGPLSLDDLLERAAEMHIPLISAELRWAVLHLVSAGKVRYTADWRIERA